MDKEKFMHIFAKEPVYKQMIDMTQGEAKDIVGRVGMKDRAPEPYTPFTTIGFSYEVTNCVFCGTSISFNGLKSAPLYCSNCISHARDMMMFVGENKNQSITKIQRRNLNVGKYDL